MKKLMIAMAIVAFASCQANKENDEGKKLAQTYCASCHSFPQPDLLDKRSWELYMLPRMGVFLGVIEHDSLRNILVANETERQLAEAAGLFPKNPVVSDEEWQKIKAYFLENAPEKLAEPKHKEIRKGLRHFAVRVPTYPFSPPSATMVKCDPANKAIFVGDANSKTLSVFSSSLQFLQGAKVGETPVSIEEFPTQYMLTVMGSFSPTDVGSGYILSLPKGQGQTYKVIDSLRRPVHSSYADLDGNGTVDIVTCEFSKWTGVLAWWKNDGNGSYQKVVLRNRPGAVKAYIRDMNRDGKPDVIALFGQGDEGIFTYYNEGNGKFREEETLKFPPSNGSTYFQLFDFNKDGYDDIIYTAGDNADFPPVLKHYHGVYVFLNDGKNVFTQKHFFQLNGAYAAMPNDYDGDGDIDIAAISFFPDYQKQPDESFVYYENDGKDNFTLSTMDNPTMGRWIVMDSGDVDGDGDTDIVLGSLAFEIVPPNPLVGQWVEKGIAFVLLENLKK